MLTPILIGLAVIVVGFLIVVALQPATFRISRTALIPAPPAVVFPHINDFHNWNAWSPWAKMDPGAKNTFSGAEQGTGAAFAWEGNSKVGAGKMTITESRPVELVIIRLEFFKPFVGTNTVEFKLQQEGEQTRLSWTMFGPNSFIGKAIGLLMNCDKMIGAQYEQGLRNLSAVVEPVAKS
jgi:hypothetical protein